MEVALVWYIILNLAIFGFVLLFVRAARTRWSTRTGSGCVANAACLRNAAD
jgi:hypothetical protein